MSTLTVAQAVAESGRNRMTIYRLIKAGELDAKLVPRDAGRPHYLINRRSFDALIERTNGSRYILPRRRPSS